VTILYSMHGSSWAGYVTLAVVVLCEGNI